jgi:superfamily II DNA/RNA helicase
MDHMERGRVDFSRLEMLILDEADRMLDMGFVDAVKKIAAATPSDRQTVLFSATLEGRVLSVAKELMRDPKRLHLAAAGTPHEHITQRAHQADNFGHKHALLTRLIEDSTLDQAVIFTATKRGAESLATRLNEDGHLTAALHGDMAQGQRRRTVEQMRRRKVRILVATDVAARGLDIDGISHVINFDLPMVAEDYVHRIGRTGRGGSSGVAISLIGPDDRSRLRQIERLTGRRLEHSVIEGLEPRARPPRDAKPRGHKPGGARPPRRGAPRRDGGRAQRRPA